jgi:hypothetical protein
MCPHTTVQMSSDSYLFVRILPCVLILLYVSSYFYTGVKTLLYVSSYYYICVLTLIYVSACSYWRHACRSMCVCVSVCVYIYVYIYNIYVYAYVYTTKCVSQYEQTSMSYIYVLYYRCISYIYVLYYRGISYIYVLYYRRHACRIYMYYTTGVYICTILQGFLCAYDMLVSCCIVVWGHVCPHPPTYIYTYIVHL